MATRQVENLKEVFRCFICMEKLRDARLCPHCSKLCCNACIRKWLTEQRSQCPHCRHRLNMNELVNCRWVDEVTESIDRLQKDAGASCLTSGEASSVRDRCNMHNEKLTVFCWTCQACICHHCALWGGQHSGHALKPLQDEYKTRVGQVKSEVKKLRRHLCQLIGALQELEANIEAVRRAKEERVREIRCAVELMIARLDSSMRNKLVTLTGQKQALSAELEMVEHLAHEVEDDLANWTPSDMVKRSAELLGSLKEVQRPMVSLPMHVSPEFVSEIIPPYDCHTMVLENFTQLRAKAEPVYSTPLQVHGMSWRLKVYPDGNGIVRGAYLSVFLELTSGPPEAAKYEYRVDMVHRDGDPTRNIVREFASDFEVGECWGYNRFFKLEFLSSEGFLDEETDSLMLQFQVRAPTYYQKCKDYSWHINQLEATCARHQLDIDHLTQHLLAGSVRNVTGSASDEELAESYNDQQTDLNDTFSRLQSSVHIDFLPIAAAVSENSLLERPLETSSNHELNLTAEFKDCNQILPGEVPSPAEGAEAALAAGGDNVQTAQRDVEDENAINGNDAENSEAIFLNESLAGMNLDFTVPDRESPPVVPLRIPVPVLSGPNTKRALTTQRSTQNAMSNVKLVAPRAITLEQNAGGRCYRRFVGPREPSVDSLRNGGLQEQSDEKVSENDDAADATPSDQASTSNTTDIDAPEAGTSRKCKSRKWLYHPRAKAIRAFQAGNDQKLRWSTSSTDCGNERGGSVSDNETDDGFPSRVCRQKW